MTHQNLSLGMCWKLLWATLNKTRWTCRGRGAKNCSMLGLLLIACCDFIVERTGVSLQMVQAKMFFLGECNFIYNSNTYTTYSTNITLTFTLTIYLLIIYMKKLLDSDWLRVVQFKCNTSAKSVTPVQKV